MKRRIIFTALIFLSGLSFAQSTLPVIPFGDRKADLYYWDTNWIDRDEIAGLNHTNYPVEAGDIYYIGDMYIGRACIANKLMIRGIAGAVSIQNRLYPQNTLDTTLSGRVPEEFKLYDANYNLLGEGRWDTVTPTYRMEFRRQTERDTFDVYEVYFEKEILVNGQFYVGGTTHNNLQYGMTSDLVTTQFEHLWTIYPGYLCNTPAPNPYCILYRYFWPYLYHYPHPNHTFYYDTTTFVLNSAPYIYFYPFFAIIDTDYVYYDCQQPTGLRVGYVDEDSVVVAWDSAAAEMWDVLVWNDGIEPDSGMHFTVQTNQLELTGLDTSRWYNIKVMALCDTMGINTSAWSNVFRLHIPDYIVQPCEVPEGLRVQPLQRNGVIVRWNPGDAGLWELTLWREEGTDTTLMQSQVEYVEVDDLDTAVWYAVRLRAVCDSNNLSEWTDTVRFFVPNWDTTGTEPIAVETAVDRSTHLMPNPTNDKVTVVSTYQLQKVELFGIDGKRIASYPADGLSAELDLSAYPSGTYIVRATTSAGVTTKRLVKK